MSVMEMSHRSKAFETIITIGSLTTIQQAVAAVGAMTFIGLCARNTKFTFFAIFITKAGRAGVTFLTVYVIISGTQAGTAVFTGSAFLQMADQTGIAVCIASVSTIFTATTDQTNPHITSACITLRTMILLGTV